MVDATGTTNYTYDNRNRLKIKATPEGTLNYTYDAHGNVLTIASSNASGAFGDLHSRPAEAAVDGYQIGSQWGTLGRSLQQ